MSGEIVPALIALAAALGVAAISAIFGLRLWESQKLQAVQPLTEERIKRYARLWRLTDFGTEDHPKDLTIQQRLDVADELRRWYYERGSGLLLSEDARLQWTAAVCQLERSDARPGEVRLSMSCLRTRLKQDVHVHDPYLDDSSCRGEVGWRDRRNILERLKNPIKAAPSQLAQTGARGVKKERDNEADPDQDVRRPSNPA